MKTEDIKKLIEAFYNGEASHEEEKILLEYFSSDNVAEELLDEKEIFMAAFEVEQTDEPIPSGLEQRLTNLIDDLDRKEQVAAKKQRKNVRLITWVWTSGVAACLAILLSLGIHFNKNGNTTGTTDSIAQINELSEEDLHKMKEAEKALMMLSSNYNKGINQLNAASEGLNKTNEILNKALNKKNNKEL